MSQLWKKPEYTNVQVFAQGSLAYAASGQWTSKEGVQLSKAGLHSGKKIPS